jgi:8-oxo-dGTP diphosphatase
VKYVYEYPRPMVTVDILLWRHHKEKVEILLIRRGQPPFQGKWALPGGFIRMGETLEESARRELAEETGMKNVDIFPLTIAGDPGRDPRGRTITSLFTGFVTPPFPSVVGGDDASEVGWFAIDHLPQLAFDHSQLFDKVINELKYKLYWQFWILMFFSREITLADLEAIFKIFWKRSEGLVQMLTVAQHLKLIRAEKADYWKRTAPNRQIISLTSENLITAWQQAG